MLSNVNFIGWRVRHLAMDKMFMRWTKMDKRFTMKGKFIVMVWTKKWKT